MIRRSPADAAANAEACLGDNGFEALPVDLDAIAAHLDIAVGPLQQDGPGVSGMLLRRRDAFGILFGTHVRSIRFRRFRIAHEIGTTCWKATPSTCPARHDQPLIECRVRVGRSIRTRGRLLRVRPPHARRPFKAAMRRLDDGLAGIEALADKCLTSATATAIAYARKASVPVSIVVSTRGRVDFADSSASMQQFGGSAPAKGSTVLLHRVRKVDGIRRRHPGRQAHGGESQAADVVRGQP